MKRSRTGFTLIEVIVVITIIGIFAAVAVPSMIGFIEHGKQTSRMNIARTLYLAAQNQLTDGFYTDLLGDAKESTRNVAQLLAENFPEEEAANADYVRYISKPKAYTAPADAEIDAISDAAKKDEAEELRSFYYLLDEIIIDKAILNDAILMEYNIKTGVVLSLFYGDAFEAGQTEFAYLEETNHDSNNVTGGRGANAGYQYAAVRKQGYYGVEATGAAAPRNLRDIANIYDGITRPLDIGFGEKKVNVLYAEFLLAKQYQADGITEDVMPAYTFEIVNADSADMVISVTVDNPDEVGFLTSFNSSKAIYRDTINPVVVEQGGMDVGKGYNRYIWIIDYIEGDLPNSRQQSIGSHLIEPQNVRAKAGRDGGAGVTSLSLANTHFNGDLSGGRYEIKSARHLYNIRYHPGGKYRQTADIDLLSGGNEITNFAPIAGVNNESFTGEYYAMKDTNTQYRIINLNIDTDQASVGLFANVSGRIQGISLYQAVINAANSDNVGAIAGTLTGGTIRQCNSYANITVSSNKSTNVGGLVGCIANDVARGTLEQSFNAGFYNAPDQSATADGYGSVTSNCGNTGGLVGLSYGSIQNSFNNARVNVINVSVTKDGEKLSYDPVFAPLSAKASVGGIVGYNSGGTIENTYATNYVSRLTDFDSTYGGISGFNSGSCVLQNNWFLANGCTGSEAVTKDMLRANPCGSMFAQTNITGDNSYKEYSYPMLKNNNPFGDPGYDWVKYACGWENIEDVSISYTGLLYYELYNDGTVGFSGGDFAPLVPSGSTKLVVNDGYVLDIGLTSAAMTVTIGTETYTLTVTDAPTPGYTWHGSGASNDNISAMVRYTADVNGTDETRFLLFFDNSFLEGRADGAANIDFKVAASNNTIIAVKFNPLFANAIGKEPDNFLVHSPRHFDNINRALNKAYSQGLNLDFALYRRSAAFTNTATGTTVGNMLSYDSNAVVPGTFAGDYHGNSFYIKNVVARYGVFEAVGSGAVVKNITLQNATLSAFLEKEGNIGGIAGTNSGTISNCKLENIYVYGEYNVGGVAGLNTASGCVLNSGAMYSTVSSNGNNAGGIAGNNAGTIADVFFLSVNDVDDIPVSAPAACGGIVGNNDGSVANAFYFAPAPGEEGKDVTTIYPIVGNGTAAEKNDSQDTCFYLAGSRYSLNEGISWISTNYNRVYTNVTPNTGVVLGGGGMGVVTKFVDKEWLEFAYDLSLNNWHQPTNGYPYLMPGGMAAPGNWPQADSPARPDQEDRNASDWADTESTSDRGRNVIFLNGDFAAGDFAAGDCFEIVENATNGRRVFIHMNRVSGWSTRPVDHNNPGDSNDLKNRNYLIELQEPVGTSGIESSSYNDYMASNYQGNYNNPMNILTSDFRYAELNADARGTLYQLCATTPGAEFFYSFHHATRHTNKTKTKVMTDQMNFYLTGVGDNDNFADDNALTLIRPCWSPRRGVDTTYNTTAKTGSDWGKTSLRWNPAVRDTVKYDTLGSGSTQINAGDLSYYADKFPNWPANGTRIYLYDVWIGNTAVSTTQTATDGYGLTFWSTSNRTLTETGYKTLANLILAAPEAATNVIGYWDISYGWKHYYGLYKVPADQTRTEFAYQSRTVDASYTGNYLDGISFKAPAFLSIDKYMKDQSDENTKFVSLDDEVTVELHVTSYGEIAAANMVITDQLAPYDKYIDFVAGSVTVKKGTTTIAGSTITPPADGNNQTLTVKLPATTTLAAGETLTVTFKVKVRREVKHVNIETLLFYFKNQAEVRYQEDNQANGNNVKKNASEILQVYIDPIKLSKTVTPSKDGPFTVTMSVEDILGSSSSITTKGLITDLIPAGFTVVNAPAGALLTQNANGSTQIAIRNVNLGTAKKLEYTYTLAYTGTGCGVAYTSASADYKYQYVDEQYNLSVLMEFPNQLVGISVKTQDDVFQVGGSTASTLLNITANDNFAEVMADANYDVTPEVVLLRNSEGLMAEINGAGNYQIDTPQYTAVLIKGSNRLEFTPKPGSNGSCELYYQINLNAAKTGNVSFALSSKETKVTVQYHD